MNTNQLTSKIESMEYNEAIKWVLAQFPGSSRQAMGHDAICRIADINDPKINSILFFNYYPLAGRVSFGFNHQIVSFA